MKLTVVIPCRNEVGYIEECIRAIYNSTIKTDVEMNVFVVDGMSEDGTRELVETLSLEFPSLHLIDNEKRLTPFAFNIGIKAGGECDFVQIIGARHVLSKRYLQMSIQKLLEKDNVWCIGGQTKNEYTNVVSKTISKAMSTVFGMGIGNFRILDRSSYTDTVGCPMYKYEVFEKIGFFDETLVRNQDDEFNFRVSQAGGKIYYEHDISVKYYVRGTFKGLWRQFYQYGYWKVFVNKKHSTVTTIRQLIPPGFVLYSLSLILLFFISVKLFLFASIFLMLHFLLNVFFSLKNADSVKDFFDLFKVYLILHFSYGLGYLNGILHFFILQKKPSERHSKLSRSSFSKVQKNTSLLILTQYYPPEIGAPQNRLHELAVRLKMKGINVEVLTAMPNYPKMEILDRYKNNAIKEEVIDGVKVYRSSIYVSKSKSMFPRLLNYFSFVWTSYLRGRKLEKYDYLMVESPPLFLGYSAIALSKKLKAKMIFNVSDLWPESAEKMGMVSNKRILKIAYNLEEKCYRKAELVTGQTMGIVNSVLTRFPKVKTHWLPNGVDLSFYDPEKVEGNGFRQRNGFNEDDVIFFYGGIIGHAQGLQVVLKAAKQIENKKVKIILQGAGPELKGLLELNEKLGLKNVFFLAPVQKTEMPGVLKEVDVALVPLRKLDIFQGAIPSKIFEALSMKKALLLGVEGEAKHHFIDKANAGLFFEPENENELAKQINHMANNPNEIIKMGENARVYVRQHFNRDIIAEDFLKVLKH